MADTPSAPTVSVISLASHDETVQLVGSPDLASFVDAANAKVRIKGLADELNPRILDLAKLKALVASLSMQSSAIRDQLAGHKLVVDAVGLGVLSIEPTRVEAFGSGYTLVIERAAGQYILAHSNVATDSALAQQRSAAAKAALAAAEKAATAVEHGKPDPDGLDASGARWRRAQAAAGWLIAARAWQKAVPANAEAKKAETAAEKAARAYAMPSGGRI